MRNVTLLLALPILVVATWLALPRETSSFTAAQEKKGKGKPDKAAVKKLMARKLDHSQKLLAALVTNDLENAGKEAEELLRVRKEAAWAIVKTEMYERWSEEFTANANKVITAAREKNLDAGKLAYLEMTLTCFNCHTYVRDLGDIQFIDPLGR
jgi:hypothetical protein